MDWEKCPICGHSCARCRRRSSSWSAREIPSSWRSAKSYKAERGTASAWLYAVARHAIIDRARQKRETAIEVPEEADTRAGPVERAEESWLTWRVHSALELLPERERVVIELAYWSGLSQTEIASYLDVPLGTVKTRTRTGLGRLAGLLEEVKA